MGIVPVEDIKKCIADDTWIAVLCKMLLPLNIWQNV